MVSGWYSKGLEEILRGDLIFKATGGSSMKAILLTNAYTFSTTNAETHDFVDDISANRGSGTTDQTITGLADPNEDTVNDRMEADATGSLTWTAVSGGQTLDGIALYRVVGTEATDPLIAYLEFTTPVVANGGDIVVDFDANGMVAISYVAA